MKKVLLSVTTLLVVSSLIFTGCKKDDSTAPEVTLIGDADITLLLQGDYTELGATASDDEDGDNLSVSISGTVDEDLKGVYIITYSATDAAGNEGTATRTVTVNNGAEAWEGKYDGQEVDLSGPYTYSGNTDPAKTVTITVSTILKNRIFMTRLGDFANNTVYMDISGTTVTLPIQTVNNVGTGPIACDVHNRRSDGTGVKTGTGFNLTYNDEKLSPCSGSRSGVVATFTKK